MSHKTSPLIRLSNTKDASTKFIRSLLYGLSGKGKTFSFKTLPSEKLLLLVTESKFGPLIGSDQDVIECSTWPEIEETVSSIRSALDAGQLEVNGNQKTILGLDSLSRCSDLCRADILATTGKETLTQADWGLHHVRIHRLIQSLINLKIHLICTSLESFTENRIDGRMNRQPALPGQVGAQAPSYFDLCLRMETHEAVDSEGNPILERKFRTSGGDEFVCKGHERLQQLEPAHWGRLITTIFRKES